MKLSVITPIGPRHGKVFREWCEPSVRAMDRGLFDVVRHTKVDDTTGELGRSRARNLAMDLASDCEWFFFLDADDRAEPTACDMAAESLMSYDAVFGQVVVDMGRGRYRSADDTLERPVTLRSLTDGKVWGGLSMGCFVRAALARHVGFDGRLDVAEDMDFYCAIASEGARIAKLDVPLAYIGRIHPSSSGRSARGARWTEACDEILSWWARRGVGSLTNRDLRERRGA